MAKLSKRIKGFLESIDQSKAYNMQEAFKIIKENSKVKFNESVDVSINLGIDAKKSDQNVRGSLVLPNGTGKSVKVAVFCEGDEAGIIHCSIGKVDFSEQMLEENLSSLIAELNRVKPASAKGKYLQKISVSSSMGLSLNLDQALLV